MIRFIIGRSGSGKTQRIMEEISAAVASGKRDIILLVPEQQSHAMERMLCEYTSNSISMSAEAVTFRRLCRYVSMQAGGLSKNLLDDGARIIYMYQALSQSRTSFKTLKTASLRPEFLDTLLSVVDSVKDCGIMPEELMQAASEFPDSLREKLEDIATVYAAYQGALSSGNIDPTGEMQKLESDLKTTDYFKGKTVWVDGFTGFTGIEYKILRRIFAGAEQVTVSLCADLQDTSAAFSKANETLKRLQAMCPRENQVLELESNMRAANPSLCHLERSIISDCAPEVFPWDAAVELAVCDNIYGECEFAASRILELVRSGNYRFRDISVSVRNVDAYADTIESVFSYYGVPVYLSRKSPVLEKAAVAVAVNALKCISGDFRYDDMLRYIKNGLIGVSGRASDLLEEYMSVWHLRGSDWSSESGFTRHPLGYGASPTEDSERLLKVLNRIRGKVRTPLINLRNAMKADPTGEGCARAIFSYFEDIRLAERLEARAALLRRRGDLQGAEEYSSLWNVLCNAVNSIGRVLGNTHFEADEFCRLFSLVLSKYKVGTIPTALDRVSVGDLSRPGVLGQVRCQIILGANDGSIPMTGGDRVLFTESDVAVMSDAGIELVPDSRRRLEEEFRLVYAGMTAPRELLIVSRPLTLSSGENAREAFVYTRLKQMFPQVTERFVGNEVRAAAPTPCFDAAAQGGSEWSGAREWLESNPNWSSKIKLAQRGSNVPRGPIKNAENIRAVFGGEIRLSASRADVFGACKYRYFLQYGLKLKRSEPARLDAPAAGTLIHYILEITMRKVQALGGTNAVSPEQIEQIALAAAAEYADNKLGGLEDKSPRFRFIFNRLCSTAVQVAKDVRDELNISSFKPLSFELKVSDNNGDLPAVHLCRDGASLRLEGFVDRVDGMELPDGRLCLRVVDYKTGKKDFRMDEALNGLNIQLLVYLFALENGGKAIYGKEIVPAGVLYVPARDPELSATGRESCEELQKLRLKELRRKGVLLNDSKIISEMEHGIEKDAKFLPVSIGKDGEFSSRSGIISEKNLKKLKKHMDDTLCSIASSLSQGDVQANPYYKSRTDTACVNCPYRSACMFDSRTGDKTRYLFKNAPEEFFAEKEEEVKCDEQCTLDD